MGLFGKKKNSYEEASKNLTEEVSAADRLIMVRQGTKATVLPMIKKDEVEDEE